MREVIDRILGGKYEYESGEVSFSESRIEINLQEGEDFEGRFELNGTPGCITKGFIYTSDGRMECLTKQFFGAREEIAYRFHGKGMESGDVLQGSFYVVSNQGEFELPFVVMTHGKTLMTSLGAMKNLFHFANLAKSSWSEAVALFYHPDFEKVFDNGDGKYRNLYKGLSKYPGNERNVEEFLIAVHKKQAVNYIIDEDKLRLEDVDEDLSCHEVLLTKNGWGYCRLEVEAGGNFLSVDKKELDEDDFPGNRCYFKYYVNREGLHKGINYGELRFYNNFMETAVRIEVRMEDEAYGRKFAERKKKELLVRIMDCYGAFRMRKIGTKAWLAQNYEILDEWAKLDDADPLQKLYRSHLLLTEGWENEAGSMLDEAHSAILLSSDMDRAVWCYYLYLSTLRKKDEYYVAQIAEEVASAWEREPDNWRLGWLMIYLSPEYSESSVKKWRFIKGQFGRGCTSPVFYIEALMLIRAEPSLFMELGEFELQMLRYAAKRDFLTDEIISQLHYLASRKSGAAGGLLSVLKKCYEKRADSETLRDICALLIRENRQGAEAFRYYAAGVEANLRITKLYEYFMYSLDKEKLIMLPKQVYLYFTYQNNLDWGMSAYLYASLFCYRAELPELYEKELIHMQEFVLRMIQRGMIDRNLAFLYKNLVVGRVMLEEAGARLAPLLYSVRVKTEDGRMRKLIVRCEGEAAEKSVSLDGGRAVFSLYGEDCALLLEDGDGNRYVPEDSFELERLFTDERLLSEAQERDFRTDSLQIALCSRHMSSTTVDSIRRYERVFESGETAPSFRRSIIPGMAKFYYDSGRLEELDLFLGQLSPLMLDAAGRGEIIRYLTFREKLETAVEWIKKYGVSGADPKILLRLASRMVQRLERARDETVLSICFYAFWKGKADETTLQYLMDYFEGGTKTLRDIWKAAEKKGMDVHDFSEKILIQMLYSGGFVGEVAQIFRRAAERDADSSLEKAFLSRCAYGYFVKNQMTEPVIFEEIRRLFAQGEPMPWVCTLAYARHCAESRGRVRGEDGSVFAACLQQLMAEGVVLPCFPGYADLCPALRRFCDKTILEHRTKPGRRVFLYYMIAPMDGEYRKMEMNEIYGGVFCNMFVLFYGEKLYYYIAETAGGDDAGREEITCSGTLSGDDLEGDVQGVRFRILNDAVIAEMLQDYNTVEALLLEYEKTDQMQKELFRICR